MSEKVKVKITRNVSVLPAIALRGLVVFPNNIVHFEVGRAKSIAAIEAAMHANSSVFLVAQKEMDVEEPTMLDLYGYGVIAEIKQVLRVSDDLVKVLVEGKTRARLLELNDGDFLQASVRPVPVRGIAADKRTQVEALVRSLKDCFEEYLSYSPQISKDIIYNIVSSDSPLFLSEYMPANLLLKYEDKQTILNESSLLSRLEKLLMLLRQECQVLEIERDLDDKVNASLDKGQREYYLREQMHIISEELGDSEDTRAEADTYRQKIAALKLDDESTEKLLKECDRLARMQSNSAESGVIRSYLDTCLGLPWHITTEDDLDQAHARRVLDREHYGLQKVKERILELLAVRKLNTEVKGQIVCLVGPPGVGKTSIARSIAESLGRKYVRISLGGVRDEAEIRGHRRTYIGAMPGKIISAMITAKSSNPLMLLDEIDKLAGDFRGDPAAALLEALDPEQNSTFNDHFLDIPFDLSHVLFITTANDLGSIPGPLRDRMDVIELPSYTRVEKYNIARKHLLPKQLKEHGLKKTQLRITDDAIRRVIAAYTKESGVRVLERQLGKLCRKAAMQLVEGDVKRVDITENNLKELLGTQQYSESIHSDRDQVGVVNGLAWTQVGGEILEVEAQALDGSGKLELTGNLGSVMQESAKAALTCLRSRWEELGLPRDFYKTKDVHVHFPEGAVPKDGPSAGIAITTAMLSALTGRPVRGSVAMTGEVTLRGRVLAIGGLKEKTMAALRNGVHTVLIPRENVKDLDEIDQTVRAALRFIPVETVDQVFAEVFCPSRVETKADAIPAFLPVENSKEAALRQ